MVRVSVHLAFAARKAGRGNNSVWKAWKAMKPASHPPPCLDDCMYLCNDVPWDTQMNSFGSSKPPVQIHNNPSGTCPAVLALALCLSATLVAGAQSGLEAAHISPTLYFRSDADEVATRTALHARVSPEIAALTSTTLKSLPKELDRCESLIAALQTHDAFLKIRRCHPTRRQEYPCVEDAL